MHRKRFGSANRREIGKRRLSPDLPQARENSIYLALWRNDNHRVNMSAAQNTLATGQRAADTLALAFRNEGKGNVDRKAGFKRGRRRTRQDQISAGLQGCESIGSSRAVKPTEIADPWDPHRTKKTAFLLPDRLSKRSLCSNLRSGR